MKRAAKVCLIIAVIMIISGGAVFCAAMQKIGWDFSSFGGGKYVTRTVPVTGDFQNISVSGDTDDVSFLLSDDGKCRVEFYESEIRPHDASVENGTLSVRCADTREWYVKFPVVSVETPVIKIYLPRKEYGAVSVRSDTGDVTVPKEFSFESVGITTDTGDVDLLASAAGTVRIETDTGDILCEGVKADEVSLTVNTGKVDAISVSCGSFASTGDTGDISMKDVIAARTLTVVRGTGDVSFNKCDAGSLSVETDTGDVGGSLLTPKVFIATSDTGSIDVPGSASGGTCTVTTDTGDIKLTVD